MRLDLYNLYRHQDKITQPLTIAAVSMAIISSSLVGMSQTDPDLFGSPVAHKARAKRNRPARNKRVELSLGHPQEEK